MWAQIINTLLGIALMALPNTFEYSGSAADNDHIIGPLVVSFAIIGISGCTRTVAFYNIPLGIWLLLAPLILGYDDPLNFYVDMGCGIAITLLAFVRRHTSNQYGGGWSVVWKKKPLTRQAL
ncbi:MAG TPA: hypothetical protein VD884_09755 [Ohtaekwangia sp.]|nr:hypothetical protein [Ohtaekwangia sp.]